MISLNPQSISKKDLIAALQRQNFKEITIYEPLDDVALRALKGLKKDKKSTVVILT